MLDGLDEHGLVQRVDFGDGITRFEPTRTDQDHHHHLICDGCGKVEAFADDRLERVIAMSNGAAATPSPRTTSCCAARAADCR